MNDALRKAREILRDVTPLKSDCGRICGARCCQSLEAEESGMLLFPGEEEAYRDKAGWILRDTSAGLLVICPGRCRREERPLACRLFPLLPVIRESGIKAAADQRARGICPLLRQGIRGLDPAFVSAAREAGNLLAQDAECRAFLLTLTAAQDELKELRSKLGADMTTGEVY